MPDRSRTTRLAMKTFTARELGRNTASVLAACEEDGEVTIRRRDGRSYLLQPCAAEGAVSEIPDIEERLREAGLPAVSAASAETVDQLISGR